jgi:putative colanic acid biosynthesis acetyltransferase WcaF
MISQPLQNSQINDLPSEQKLHPFVDLSKYDQSSFDRGRPGWFIILWWLVQAVTFPLTLHSFSFIRCAILRLFGAKIGKNVLIRPTARFTYPWKVTIGDHSWIGDDVVIYSIDRVNIGNHCIVSQKSYLCTGSHDIKDPTFALETASITIEDGAWVAADCFVAAGVTIGVNAVIGARSSVFGNMPAGQVCMGSPCRPRFARKMNHTD